MNTLSIAVRHMVSKWSSQQPSYETILLQVEEVRVHGDALDFWSHLGQANCYNDRYFCGFPQYFQANKPQLSRSKFQPTQLHTQHMQLKHNLWAIHLQ